MNRINLNNYEVYFLDYLEGRLSDDAKGAVEGFLAIHPELSEEFESISDAFLKPGDDSPFDFSNLKKPELPTGQDALDIFLARSVEGDLSPAEQESFEKEKSVNPELAGLSALFEHSKLYASKLSLDKEALLVDEKFQISVFELLALRSIDGNLSAEEEGLFLGVMNRNPEFNKKYEMLKATELSPIATELYTGKSLMKEGAPVIKMWVRAVAVAAVAVLALLLWNPFQTAIPVAEFAESGNEIELTKEVYKENALENPLDYNDASEQSDNAEYEFLANGDDQGGKEGGNDSPDHLNSPVDNPSKSEMRLNMIPLESAMANALPLERNPIDFLQKGENPELIFPEERQQFIKLPDFNALAARILNRNIEEEGIPEEGMALALLDKVVETYADNGRRNVDLEVKKEGQDSKGFRLTLGGLTISHSKALQP